MKFFKSYCCVTEEIGYDVTSIGEDNPGIYDYSVMEIAETEQRIILTFDRD